MQLNALVVKVSVMIPGVYLGPALSVKEAKERFHLLFKFLAMDLTSYSTDTDTSHDYKVIYRIYFDLSSPFGVQKHTPGYKTL